MKLINFSLPNETSKLPPSAKCQNSKLLLRKGSVLFSELSVSLPRERSIRISMHSSAFTLTLKWSNRIKL